MVWLRTLHSTADFGARAGGYRFYAGLGKEEVKWAKQRFRSAEVRTAARLLRCLASGTVLPSVSAVFTQLQHDALADARSLSRKFCP